MPSTSEPSAKNNDDYYAVLGVNKTATEEQIKEAYRKLALELHPDKNSDPDATARFQAVNKAHRVLSDENLRTVYDLLGAQGLSHVLETEPVGIRRVFLHILGADMADQCKDYESSMAKMSGCQKCCGTLLCCSTGCCFGCCCCCFCGCLCCCNFCCNHCCGLKKRPRATHPSADENESPRHSSVHRQPTDSAKF